AEPPLTILSEMKPPKRASNEKLSATNLLATGLTANTTTWQAHTVRSGLSFYKLLIGLFCFLQLL
ncbi:MAG: hypothetical protein WCD32_14355, partial [Azonexus sp.]